MKADVQKWADSAVETGKIDAELRDEISKYTKESSVSKNAKELEIRLTLLVQKKKYKDFCITNEERDGVLNKTNKNVSPALYIISDILEE